MTQVIFLLLKLLEAQIISFVNDVILLAVFYVLIFFPSFLPSLPPLSLLTLFFLLSHSPSCVLSTTCILPYIFSALSSSPYFPAPFLPSTLHSSSSFFLNFLFSFLNLSIPFVHPFCRFESFLVFFFFLLLYSLYALHFIIQLNTSKAKSISSSSYPQGTMSFMRQIDKKQTTITNTVALHVRCENKCIVTHCENTE